MVIASQDIHYASHEMTISHRERRFTMYIDGMMQDDRRYKKPMASSEGSALVGMVTMARRKTRFPTDIGSNPTEAKPTASVTAFCVYLIPIQHQRVKDNMHIKHPH